MEESKTEEQRIEERKAESKSLKATRKEFVNRIFAGLEHKMKVENLPKDKWVEQLKAFIEYTGDCVADNDELVKALRKRVRDDYISFVWTTIGQLNDEDEREQQARPAKTIILSQSSEAVMAALTTEWQTIDEITQKTGLRKTQVSQALFRLRHAGKVKNTTAKDKLIRGMYRLVKPQ